MSLALKIIKRGKGETGNTPNDAKTPISVMSLWTIQTGRTSAVVLLCFIMIVGEALSSRSEELFGGRYTILLLEKSLNVNKFLKIVLRILGP